jgi:dihydropteroate synthase
MRASTTCAPDAPVIEPLGLLHGEAGARAVADGHALWLAGGPAAFALARLEPDGPVVPAHDLPPSAARARLTEAPPPWAGLPIHRPLVMGIVNVTPDSFSDGGLHASAEAAIAAGRAMIAAGADLLDIGGESTRPGAQPIPPDEEQRRILPVIRALARQGVPLSVDTRYAVTMAAALDAGAAIVNDVSALTHDPEAAPLLAARGCPVVLMHMRGTPATMQSLTQYGDVARDVAAELAATLEAAERVGIRREAVALDPGIGFAKGPGQNEELLARLPLLLGLGCRLLVGVSRKGFIGRLSGETAAWQRLPGSIAAGVVALAGGVAILRVHDVAQTVQAVRVWQGILRPSIATTPA